MQEKNIHLASEFFFKGYQLSDGQAEALRKLELFLSGECPLFLLKGYAGTGKTFLIKGLTDYLSMLGRSFHLMAPTGRASRVVREKASREAFTIHKSIYDFSQLKEYKHQGKDGDESFRFYFELRNNYNETSTVYIVDEASMISDQYNDDEFFRFGSGYLLNDLIQYVGQDAGISRKIIFIGDDAQLPPVNMNFSPALDASYMNQKYGLSSEEYELTEVVRQKEKSGILVNATRLRDSLKQEVYSRFKIDTDYPDITSLEVEDILHAYSEKVGEHVDLDTIIVAHSNSKVYEYNSIMRSFLFPGREAVGSGDRALVVKNNYNHTVAVYNGDMGFIVRASGQTETRKTPVGKGKPVALTFRDIEILLLDERGRPIILPCKMVENLLNSRERDLSADEKKALYIDFKIRHPDLKPENPLFAETLKKDPYFNCLFLKYGYAVTCHKAQGGEWQTAFIDFNAGMGYLTAAYFRWAYTALTRGQEHVFAMNLPHRELYDNLTAVSRKDSLPPSQQPADSHANPLVLPVRCQEAHGVYDFPSGSEHLQSLCVAVIYLLEESAFNVESIRHLQYCERYYMGGLENEVCYVDLYYNKQGIVTKVLVSSATDSTKREELAALLRPLVGRAISLEADAEDPREAPPANISFDADKPFLEEFYNDLKKQMAIHNIHITKVTHHSYQAKYEFTRESEKVVVNFYYNKKGQFTSYQLQSQSSNSAELFDEICKLMEGLKGLNNTS